MQDNKEKIEKIKPRKVWVATGNGLESVEVEELTSVEAKLNEIIAKVNELEQTKVNKNNRLK